jgi:7-carboxy-7-deazaguanine synthase
VIIPAQRAPRTEIQDPPSLLVAETFGPTFQGEGPRCGQQALFVRLSRCNLCCIYCDTPYTWNWEHYDPRAEARRMPVSVIAEWILSHPRPLVVITGGEPLLQQASLLPLIDVLHANGRGVEIETNGTVIPAEALSDVTFNVSPKLTNAGMPLEQRIIPEALEAFVASGRAVFKFVAVDMSDLDEIASLEERHGLAPIWVMPEGTDTTSVLERARLLADEVLTRGWHLTTRLHVLLWEAARGR